MKTKPKQLTIVSIVSGIAVVLGFYWAVEDRFTLSKDFEKHVQSNKAQHEKMRTADRKAELRARMFFLIGRRIDLKEKLKTDNDSETQRMYDEVRQELNRVRDMMDRLEGS